jgi:manganese transport protein
VKRYLAMTLGVVTAIGGFLDIGEFVAMPKAGATFGLALLPVLVLSTVGAMVYAEMAGRIELASRRTVFDLMRKRLGLRIGLVALSAALVLNVLTLVAELGGMAFVAELVLGRRFLWYVLPLALVLALFVWLGSWSWQENLPSILGLATLVVPASLVFGSVPVSWGTVARSVVAPSLPSADHTLLATTAIAVLGAGMSPYEWYFYSSGAREEGWTRRDLMVNRVTAIGGFALGSLLSVALLVGAATLFLPVGLDPNHLAQTGLLVAGSFGSWGVAIFLVGAFGCVLGAAIETSVSSAQTVAEFFGWPWGSSRPARAVPGFTLVYLAAMGVAVLILLAGFDPIKVTVVALVFSVGALPFTFLPMLIVANDPYSMGEQTNGRLANALGCFFLVVLAVAGAAALPLIIITGGAI